MQGLSQWCMSQADMTMHQWSPTIGTLNPVDIAITQAHTDQTNLIGWDNLLRGRLSILWEKAIETASTEPLSTATRRVKKIIPVLWEYSQSIEEQRAKEVKEAQIEIKLVYEEYVKDHFVIPSHLRYLFISKL